MSFTQREKQIVAAPVHNPTFGETPERVAPFQMQVKLIDTSEIDSGYAPFMSNGFGRLIGNHNTSQLA